ncbi:MAG: hypothetical protein VB084_16155 [Syntrophomonadaceae bacterium]|nr:hypothetical protein [Syntrophomonadaceae bacterium]
MAKLRVKLKQHTPLIHFQAYQEGATLRASELKPKLDRFLIEEVLKDFDVYKKLLLGYKSGKTEQDYRAKKSFDYKVRILAKSQNEIDKPHNSLYFGNMGKLGQPIQTVKHREEIWLDFFSLNHTKIETQQSTKNIMEIIAENIDNFLAVTNFGTRQSKGFGSFFSWDKEEQYISILKKVRPQFVYIEYDHKNFKTMMDHIAVIYPLMKSGLNFPENKEKHQEASYHRSFLFNYMNARGIGNEKRFIKEKFFQPPIVDDGNEKQYVRAMLGACEGINFRAAKKNISYKNTEIQRFRSPITFKIVGKYLALVPENMPPGIFSKVFSFSDGSHTENISTPDRFDLPKFLFAFADYFNDELETTEANNRFENELRRAKQQSIVKVGDNNG